MTTAFDHQFNIGDEVYYLDSHTHQCTKMTIETMAIFQYKDKTSVLYYGKDALRSFPERELFKSPEALSNHIFNNHTLKFFRKGV